MRISFAPDASDTQQQFLQELTGFVVRIFASPDSPRRPGESFDAEIRAIRTDRSPGYLQIYEFSQRSGERTSSYYTVKADRLHVY